MEPVREPGRERSFERLYRRHREEVYRALLRELGNREDAEDLTQAAFLDAYRALARGNEPERPRAWLLTIAENARRRRFRALRRRPQEAALEHEPAATEAEVTVRELRDALERLPARQRDALVLREVGGLGYGEIAARLNVSVASVQMLLFRARRGLRAELESDAPRRRASAWLPWPLSSWPVELSGAHAGGTAAARAAGVVAAGVLGATAVGGGAPARPSLPADRTVAPAWAADAPVPETAPPFPAPAADAPVPETAPPPATAPRATRTRVLARAPRAREGAPRTPARAAPQREQPAAPQAPAPTPPAAPEMPPAPPPAAGPAPLPLAPPTEQPAPTLPPAPTALPLPEAELPTSPLEPPAPPLPLPPPFSPPEVEAPAPAPPAHPTGDLGGAALPGLPPS